MRHRTLTACAAILLAGECAASPLTPLLDKLSSRVKPERAMFTMRQVYSTDRCADAYPYVTGVIAGTTDEEVLTLGHTSEQGAHDNATGVAAMLEAMTVLRELIDSGDLPKPRRTIRILAMGELYGSMHYVAQNPERIKRTVAAFCMDTPAAPYEAKGTEYTFHLNPHSMTSFVDAFALKLAEEYFARVKRPWHSKPFTPGTDTFLADPMIGIPTVWPYSGTGVHTHHNSADKPETVDPRSLRDLAVIDAAFLYFLATAGEKEAPWLIEITKAQPRSAAALESIRRIAPAFKLDSVRAQPQTVSAGQSGRGIVVKRKRFGTIPLDDMPEDKREGYPSGAWATVPTIALFWCDGKRDLSEVIRLTEQELGPQKFDFVGYFRFLAKHGYVDLQDAGTSK